MQDCENPEYPCFPAEWSDDTSSIFGFGLNDDAQWSFAGRKRPRRTSLSQETPAAPAADNQAAGEPGQTGQHNKPVESPGAK